MKAPAHLRAKLIAVVCAVAPCLAPAQRDESVVGLIEGRVHADGVPLAGAIFSACRIGHEMEYSGVCTDRIEGLTDSVGGFSFMQLTGRYMPSVAEVKRNPVLAIADPGYAYGFRIDYEGKSAIFVASGMGYGRARASVNCDFQKYLSQKAKESARPIADSGNPDFAASYCKIEEVESERRQ